MKGSGSPRPEFSRPELIAILTYLCKRITIYTNSHFDMITAEIFTAKGNMKLEFYEKETPGTVKNFVDLAKKGFYDGLTFHRVIPGFVLQAGCPNTREGATGMPGTGGPGYSIPCETSAEKQYHDRGVLSMAHRGPNTGGSQFFVVLSRQQTAHLDRKHTCFGKVVEGMEVIDLIRQGDRIEKIVVSESV
ncbi:MAG: peptidyl-prolyl cis-trans isomerase B (cyclophilin B) [Bacteroidetes bacterium]|nr:MAG: peptidyl-prolyl cis-trans isomerase B (cyclophilin B) [Bacteroidota bacterium]